AASHNLPSTGGDGRRGNGQFLRWSQCNLPAGQRLSRGAVAQALVANCAAAGPDRLGGNPSLAWGGGTCSAQRDGGGGGAHSVDTNKQTAGDSTLPPGHNRIPGIDTFRRVM